jgi:hypothetical protein
LEKEKKRQIGGVEAAVWSKADENLKTPISTMEIRT